MGVFRHMVTIYNAYDMAVAKAGYIKSSEIHKMDVPMLVDSGAYMMCVNENIQQQLGLSIVGEHEVLLADGTTKLLKQVTGVEIKIFNRRTLTDALVLPGDSEPLLGSISMEALDVLIDPLMGQLKLPTDRPYIARTVLV